MPTPAPLIRPGISVLVSDVSDLDPAVNLLPGTALFYSAYPAADGKAGIYTKWGGRDGAEQAITGIRHGMAPRSTTWSKAVEILKSRYEQFRPQEAGVTSVLVLPDNDHSDPDDNHTTPNTTSASTHGHGGSLDRVFELLDTLPLHVLEEARQCRPPSPAAPLKSPSVKTPTSPTMQASHTMLLANRHACTNPVTPAKQRTTPATLDSKHSAAISTLSNTTPAPSAPLPQASHNSTTVATGLQASRPSGSTSRMLIDSPLRAVGIGPFMAPKECYVIGHWTTTVLRFLDCDQAVIPVIEHHIRSFVYDEDGVEFQASLSEVFNVELSHFVVNLLKLDAFLKSIGHMPS